jgi:hypothetical protein
MGSNEPLGKPTPSPKEATGTKESDTIIINGPDKPSHAPRGKRKRGALVEDELQAFSSITEVVRDVAQVIGDKKPVDMHPDLYHAVMSIVEFSQEALMASLGHLIDHKPQGTYYVGMNKAHMIMWLGTYLGKHYF